MRILYIDHTIVTDERLWRKLSKAIESGKVRLALSVWNFYEIGAASDLAQRKKRVSFLSGLAPLYMVERLDIQRQEVQRFLWKHKFAVSSKDIVAITPSLSVVDSFAAGSQTRIGLTICQFIREMDVAGLSPLRRLTPEALRALQDVGQTKVKRREREIFDAWIGALIPNFAPHGRAFTNSNKNKMIAFCWQHKKEFFSECRCVAVENVLTTVRTDNAQRNPEEQDGADLQHAVVALAYCDVFCTKDKYLFNRALAAKNRLEGMSLAVVCNAPNFTKTIASL